MPCTIDPTTLLTLVSYGHYEEVRMAAVDSLLALGATDDILRFLFDLMDKEPTPMIRTYIANTVTTISEKRLRELRNESPTSRALLAQLWGTLK